MLEFKFKSGEIMCIPENSVEYITIEPKKWRYAEKEEDGAYKVNYCGDRIYRSNTYIDAAVVHFKLYCFKDTHTQGFEAPNLESKVEDNEEYMSFVEFLKSAFVKRTVVKNI